MQNRLLDSLSPNEFHRLTPSLTTVEFRIRATIVRRAGESETQVLFPHDAVFAEVIELADGGTVGVGLMGSEGAVGLGLLSGDRRSLRTTMVQVPGTASRMDADVFQREVVEHAGEAKNVFRRFYDGFSEGVAQLAACIAMHPIEQRFAGRLLAIHDRVGRDTFPLTHEFEALMLGVRRASVTLAAAHLREIHAIDYHSGEVVITNRRILEQTACGCYDQITRIERAVYAHKR